MGSIILLVHIMIGQAWSKLIACQEARAVGVGVPSRLEGVGHLAARSRRRACSWMHQSGFVADAESTLACNSPQAMTLLREFTDYNVGIVIDWLNYDYI